MHSHSGVLDSDRDPSRCDQLRFWCLYRPWSGPVIGGNSHCWKRCYALPWVTLGERERISAKRHPTVREGLWSPLICPGHRSDGDRSQGQSSERGCRASPMYRVMWPLSVFLPRSCGCTVEKTNRLFTRRRKREYYMNKLEHAKEASHQSSSLYESLRDCHNPIHWMITNLLEAPTLLVYRNYVGTFQVVLISSKKCLMLPFFLYYEKSVLLGY